MRLTNVMMSNTMLGNINRNQRRANTLLNQIATGRLISNPSENPLMAMRHMRFETTVNQIEQHRRNVDQAEAWVAMTEKAVAALNTVIADIEDYLVKADAAESLSERKILAEAILSLMDEKATILNRTFQGRHIFSGLRTDQPPFFVRDMPDMNVNNITMQLGLPNLETTFMLDRSDHSDPASVGGNNGPDLTPPGNLPKAIQVHRMRLPHNANQGSVRIDGNNVQTIPRNSNGDIDFAMMSDDGIYHDPTTGELISLSRDNAFAFSNPNSTITVVYDQHGFSQQDLNPLVHFTGQLVAHPTISGLPLNFNMDSQDMNFEFGVHARMPINTLARNIVPATMWADIRGFATDILNLDTSKSQMIRDHYLDQGYSQEEANSRTQERLLKESQVIETITNNRFNNMIGRLDDHALNISMQQTEVGVRMSRLEMISERLEDDALIFEELGAQNIGIDVGEAIMRLTMAEVALQASMQAGMHNIMTLNLLNFL